AAGAELHVVSAYDTADGGIGGQPEDMPEAVKAEVVDALPAQLRRVLMGSTVQPTSECVRFGQPVRVILERSRQVGADLIVLGKHRGTDLSASFLGTTADAVVTDSPVACLIPGGRVVLPFRRIGVAVDLAPGPSNAFQREIELLGELLREVDSGSASVPRITIVHVVPRYPAGETADAREGLK